MISMHVLISLLTVNTESCATRTLSFEPTQHWSRQGSFTVWAPVRP